MKKLMDIAATCLQQGDIAEKMRLTHTAWQLMVTGNLSFSATAPPLPISATVFPARPVLLAPKHMPKRQITTPEGLAAFFHALAHIEFIAVYLAWDILYRFRGLPEQFYVDWLKVADEEAQHFELLNVHLANFGITYGDLPAHYGLWEHAEDTTTDVLARLALVPRCMEARGLDVTPAMVAKFEARNDTVSTAILSRILTDEVGHVERGSFWFNSLCAEQQLDPTSHFQQLITQYYKGGKPKGPFNKELRTRAGFSKADLDWLEKG
ncbi:MAG: ferritin-like domain-containing protein [Methylococcaceae bacterium]|nr:ferritin-like domain-containing protein [Methylococcaceae bacterium]